MGEQDARALLQQLDEFVGLAHRLGMPEREVCGILDLRPGELAALLARDGGWGRLRTPALARRLGYALPLVRRALTNRAPDRLPQEAERSGLRG